MAAVGQRLAYDGAPCTVRYVGPVASTHGSWLGVEWDDASRGKHDGQHLGVRYFSCQSKSATAASFVRPTRPADPTQSFVAALQAKYAGPTLVGDQKPIVISGKVAEEVGFDKIQRTQARLGDLKMVVLDGARIDGSNRAGERPVGEICPKVAELDLSRNLFTRLGVVADICAQLHLLKHLRLNGNRFQDVLREEPLQHGGVKELALDDTLMAWHEICHVVDKFTSLQVLWAGGNQLGLLSGSPPPNITNSLVSLHLEFNDFTAMSDLTPITNILSLRNLHLKGNRISCMKADGSDQSPVFSEMVHYVDISYNAIASWTFVDALPACFPGLTSLRLAHNAIYDNPDLEDGVTVGACTAPTTDTSYMLVAARLPGLKTLNFSAISAADRTNADLFYLSRIARQLAAVPEGSEAQVLARHRRWAELCDMYGEPTVVRRTQVDPNFLEARLITTHLHVVDAVQLSPQQRTARVPKSFDMYAVRGIVGRLFGVSPLGLRLVWETGEWDPVAGFDDDGEDGDEDEREQVQDAVENGGTWVKREVELKAGPRQFGHCVDGQEVRIRVELG